MDWTVLYCGHIGEYTYRLRKSSDDKILKAPVHANRLKKFLDPKNRPTNPPDEVDEDHDLNPEELMDMPEILDRVNDTIIKHTQNQVGKNYQNDQAQSQKDKQPSQNPNPQQDMYDVERILKCRKRGNIKQYLIKWRGYSSSQNTWEPSHHIPNHLIQHFHAQSQSKNKRKRRG